MNNKELQRYYYVNHLNIVLTQYKDIPEWLWLLSDQGILGYCARELDCKVGTLEDVLSLYSEKQKAFHLNLVDIVRCGLILMVLNQILILSIGIYGKINLQ